LPNEAGYSSEFINQLRREAIVLADRTPIDGKQHIVSPAAIRENSFELATMVDFKVFKDGVAQIGDVTIADQKDGTLKVVDGDTETLLDGSRLREIDVKLDGIAPLQTAPRFGVTFLGTSGGLDANGLASNQIIWADHQGILVDAGPAAVAALDALRITAKDMGYVALTHLHEDHVAGMLAMFAWLKKNGQPIKLLVEPGIFKLFKEQLESLLSGS
jgi:hypothetical protein